MNGQYKKKLIEVALPLVAINAASAKEKSIRHGHPSTLHLWWARRPLAACRAVLFAQLVDDPSAHPDHFPTEEDQERERKRLFEIIEDLVKWENTNNETVLERARAEIRKSCGDNPPPVYDPFCGGGSIPLEAQRLGLEAYGSDLNPVAVLITKALVEIPPKFAGCPPVNPESQAKLRRGAWNGKGAQGLAEDVRYYGQWMRDEAFKRIGHLYPQATLPDGSKATVIAWLWARTIASPNPACGGAHVPLIRSFELSRKSKNRTWIEPVVDQSKNTYRFEIRTGVGKPPQATVGRQGAVCLISGASVPLNYVRSEAKAQRMGARLMAVVVDGARGRTFMPPTDEMEKLAREAFPKDIPETDLPEQALGFRVQGYGMTKHQHLFTARQLVALETFSDLVEFAHREVFSDAKKAGLSDDSFRLFSEGDGAQAYADALSVYLGFAVDRSANTLCTLARWTADRQQTVTVFSRQALSMTWDYPEVNPLCGAAGDISVSAVGVADALAGTSIGKGKINISDAISGEYPVSPCVVCTDPPYYDNIGYADLSDFFYVWLRRSLRKFFPDFFSTLLVPKRQELVAEPFRHGGSMQAESFFVIGMSQVISKIRKASSPDYPITIYYAFKQSEIDSEGVASTGWATFLEAIRSSGLKVLGTWPMRSELGNRMRGQGSNALASSILLACRPCDDSNRLATRADFLKALRTELPGKLKLLQHGNIAPVDMAQASIGPGMAIFTRHAKVLEADDSPMTVKTALQLINQALDEYLSEQEGEYDADTRFAITWFETHGMDSGPYGTAETLATARGVAVSGVEASGVLVAKGGKVRLLKRDEMPDDWDPATDTRLTVWECTQHLIRKLDRESERSAADLLARLGERGEVARDLAYRLYGICERKKWADEALAYNGLVVAWPELTRLAAQVQIGPAQADLGV